MLLPTFCPYLGPHKADTRGRDNPVFGPKLRLAPSARSPLRRPPLPSILGQHDLQRIGHTLFPALHRFPSLDSLSLSLENRSATTLPTYIHELLGMTTPTTRARWRWTRPTTWNSRINRINYASRYGWVSEQSLLRPRWKANMPAIFPEWE